MATGGFVLTALVELNTGESWRLLLLPSTVDLATRLQPFLQSAQSERPLVAQDRRTRGTAVLYHQRLEQPMGLPFSEWAGLNFGWLTFVGLMAIAHRPKNTHLLDTTSLLT